MQAELSSVPPGSDASLSLAWALRLTSQLMGRELDRLQLQQAIASELAMVESLTDGNVATPSWQLVLHRVCSNLDIDGIVQLDTPDAARLPALSWIPEAGWVVIRALSPTGKWQMQDVRGRKHEISSDSTLPCARLTLQKPPKTSEKPAFHVFRRAFQQHRKNIVEAAVATIFINLLALGSSLYSMQVYDRVIPTQGYDTLLVLTVGVALMMLFEIVLKLCRSALMEGSVVKIDTRLSREIFSRLLSVRLDRLPASVGSLSSQMRGYETIRAFLSSSTLYLFVDAPFGFIFVILIALIGSPLLAIVPLVFLIVAFALGRVSRQLIHEHAREGAAAANKKTGILVEAIEGAETIKAGNGGWTVLSKWIDICEQSIRHDLVLRNISEKGQYLTGLIQQASYIGLIAMGAYLVTQGHMTMGALIACSILSGRALGPVASLSGIMVQAAHAKAALGGIESVYALPSDNHQQDRPITLDTTQGNYEIGNVRFFYGSNPGGIAVKRLSIRAGEKVAVLGSIGSGKSTFLRLLSGMYLPTEGSLLLDGVDISLISRGLLAERIGYLQQDHRLFSGTMRENLLIGCPDPGDAAIKAVAERSGLLEVIANHPKGLDLEITEGGKGLSGGQRQLVALTRLLLGSPNIWLLDEPMASMDAQTGERAFQALRQSIRKEDTLILATHNPSLLQIVDRVIVVAQGNIVIDGPKDEVMSRLTPKPDADGQRQMLVSA